VGADSYAVGSVKRIDVDPRDVQVVSSSPWSTSAGPPPPPGVGGWLRRNRLRVAAVLAVAEAFLWLLHVDRLALLAIAAAAIAFHFFVTPHLRSYTLRQVSWTIAFAQALVALGSIALFVLGALVVFALFTLLVVGVLVGAAALLRDRR
jgi:hypothetical protein